MDLQNIVVDFSGSKVTSFYTDIKYIIPSISNMAALKVEMDIATGFDTDRATIQYTPDQYGRGIGARIVAADGNNDPDTGNAILLLSGISANLATEIATAKGEVETEITAQTS